MINRFKIAVKRAVQEPAIYLVLGQKPAGENVIFSSSGN